MNHDKQTNQTPMPPTAVELALCIMRKHGFVNTQYAAGTLLASGCQAWRYQEDQLTEVPWCEYEKALNSAQRADWPPYTISFSVSSQPDSYTILLSVVTDYDQGICEESRGGNETAWSLCYQDGVWQVSAIDYLFTWD
jgi:hypothetical protein